MLWNRSYKYNNILFYSCLYFFNRFNKLLTYFLFMSGYHLYTLCPHTAPHFRANALIFALTYVISFDCATFWFCACNFSTAHKKNSDCVHSFFIACLRKILTLKYKWYYVLQCCIHNKLFTYLFHIHHLPWKQSSMHCAEVHQIWK